VYFIKTPVLLKKIFPNQVWSVPTEEKKLYLTFDDGPTPGITEGVLEELKKFNAKASFFLVGKNVAQYPDLVKRIRKDGHAVGNHTYNHVNGWQTSAPSYVKNSLQCAEILDTNLFRPPYGRITQAQTRIMNNRYKIIMWDVLSGDFDHSISKDKVVKNVLNNTEAGSIIVFHDSVKAAARMQYALPRVLEHYAEQGFRFEKLEFN
jgi:peptidoglycan/xylan/chitin deacetylase (PgdA/CDA1 family)